MLRSVFFFISNAITSYFSNNSAIRFNQQSFNSLKSLKYALLKRSSSDSAHLANCLYQNPMFLQQVV